MTSTARRQECPCCNEMEFLTDEQVRAGRSGGFYDDPAPERSVACCEPCAAGECNIFEEMVGCMRPRCEGCDHTKEQHADVYGCTVEIDSRMETKIHDLVSVSHPCGCTRFDDGTEDAAGVVDGPEFAGGVR